MKIKMILPALTEATSPFWRPIKYSLFPPLGLATLAGYFSDSDEIVLQDEHVEKLDLDDEPELVVIETYITSARRAYEIADRYRARGAYVAMGGLHVTALPQEAAPHADSIFIGPGEDTWPQFLADYKAGHPRSIYRSEQRSLIGVPPVRRDLIKRNLYLVPNSIVVSRGCPHTCDFCYKEAFFKGGKSFYTRAVDDALAEIERLPGKHLYFLDDHLFGNPHFAAALFDGMRGMARVWQAAGTVKSVLAPELVDKAAASGLKSLFVGFETLDPEGLRQQKKYQNLQCDYGRAIDKLHDLGVMVNASFVFGMDGEGKEVFARTTEWAVEHGIETATFHILTPYPGTALYDRMTAQGRLLHRNWDLYDTRHAVFQPAQMTPQQLEQGYWQAYRDFIVGGLSCAARGPKEDGPSDCGISLMPAAGKSANRFGIGSYAPSESPKCYHYWNRSSPVLNAFRSGRIRCPCKRFWRANGIIGELLCRRGERAAVSSIPFSIAPGGRRPRAWGQRRSRGSWTYGCCSKISTSNHDSRWAARGLRQRREEQALSPFNSLCSAPHVRLDLGF